LALNLSINSLSVFGPLVGTTITSYSDVRRATGVTWSIVTGDLFWMSPPTMTMPPIIIAFGSPLEEFTNCAMPIAPAHRPCCRTGCS
jgi:hypothetical protein